MFIEITNHASPIGVENVLRPYKRSEAEITPEVCRDILGRTNFARNIKDMLNCVSALPAEKQAAFKDVVLSTFDNREQPNDILILGKKLALSGGYEEELGELAGKLHEGNYHKSEAGGKKWTVFGGDYYGCYDFAGIERAIFSEREADCYHATNLPKHIDVSRCSKIDFGSTGKLPRDFDVSKCSEVRFCGCDFSELNPQFAEGAKVTMIGATNLPEDFDVSMCSHADLSECDLSGLVLWFAEGSRAILSYPKGLPESFDVSLCSYVSLRGWNLAGQSLQFADGAEVDFSGATNLSEGVDISNCSKVDLHGCYVANLNMSFDWGSVALLKGAKKLPASLDVSRCAEVDLRGCDLSGIETMSFAEGSDVNLINATNLPKRLDISRCSEVRMRRADLSNVDMLTFKNREQLEKSEVSIPEFWNGLLLFSDEIARAAAMKSRGGR